MAVLVALLASCLFVGVSGNSTTVNGSSTHPPVHHTTTHHEDMAPWGLNMTMTNFTILAVVMGILIVAVIILLIACIYYCCCVKKKSGWQDLHPAEIAAGMTPSMVDAGMTMSQIQPNPNEVAGRPSPLPPYNPNFPSPQPPVPDLKKTKKLDSEVEEKKPTGHVTLKKGVILPPGLIGVKPKNKKKARKGRKKSQDQEEEEEDE